MDALCAFSVCRECKVDQKIVNKKAERVKKIFELANGENRSQWEYVNQKGFDFANDNQLSEGERQTLQEQGMPDFTINRIKKSIF